MNNQVQQTSKRNQIRFVGSQFSCSQDVRDYLKQVTLHGEDNVIFSRAQAANLLYYNFINRVVLAKITKTEKPTVEAFYGYSNWQGQQYKIYVKFKKSNQYLKLDGFGSSPIFPYNLVETPNGFFDKSGNPFERIVPDESNCVPDRLNEIARILAACGVSHV